MEVPCVHSYNTASGRFRPAVCLLARSLSFCFAFIHIFAVAVAAFICLPARYVTILEVSQSNLASSFLFFFFLNIQNVYKCTLNTALNTPHPIRTRNIPALRVHTWSVSLVSLAMRKSSRFAHKTCDISLVALLLLLLLFIRGCQRDVVNERALTHSLVYVQLWLLDRSVDFLRVCLPLWPYEMCVEQLIFLK